MFRARFVAGVEGADELTDDQVQAAVGGILDALFGNLFVWALLMAFGGLVVAGAAAALDPVRTEDPVTRLRRRLVDRPRQRDRHPSACSIATGEPRDQPSRVPYSVAAPPQ